LRALKPDGTFVFAGGDTSKLLPAMLVGASCANPVGGLSHTDRADRHVTAEGPFGAA